MSGGEVGPESEHLSLEERLHDLGKALDALTEEEWEAWIARHEERYPFVGSED